MNKKEQLLNSNGSRVSFSHIHQKPRRKHVLRRAGFGVGLLVVSAMLAACSATPTPTTNPSSGAPATLVPLLTSTSMPVAAPSATSLPQPTATAVPTPTQAPVAATTPLQQAVNTLLDPCVLVPSQEASTLAGATFGQGVESSTPAGLNICTYGAQTTDVFTVEVVQAPDLADAQAAKTQFMADLQASLQQITDQGINVTQLPNFADGAVVGQVSVSGAGITLSGSAMGFLRGTIFVGFSDINMNGAAPTSDALQNEATVVLARLP